MCVYRVSVKDLCMCVRVSLCVSTSVCLPGHVCQCVCVCVVLHGELVAPLYPKPVPGLC